MGAAGQRGFALFEVVVTILLFSLAVMAFAGMLLAGRNSITYALRGTKTCLYAASQVERILSMSYDDPQLIDPDGGYIPQQADHGPQKNSDDVSSIEWEVDDDFPVAGCKRITITIRNQAPGGAREVFNYDYIKAKADL